MSKLKTRLSREKIATAALAIADREGFSAVSMRRIADELRVGTMSLYYYVTNKDDLVAAMDDALMSEALLSALPQGWRRAIMEIAKATRALFVRHPWALVSMASAPPGQNAMRHMEQCLAALAETPMTRTQKMTLLTVVDDFVFGVALRDTSANAKVDTAFAAAQLATGAFPRLSEMFRDGEVQLSEDRFERSLQALLDAHWA